MAEGVASGDDKQSRVVECAPCSNISPPTDNFEHILQVDHLTKFVMAEGAASDADEQAQEQRRGNRRDTWAPGVMGADCLGFSVVGVMPHWLQCPL